GNEEQRRGDQLLAERRFVARGVTESRDRAAERADKAAEPGGKRSGFGKLGHRRPHFRRSPLLQSARKPEAFTIGAQRAVSCAIRAARSAGLPPAGSRPSLVSRSRSSPLASALLIAALSWRTVDSGVFAGA